MKALFYLLFVLGISTVCFSCGESCLGEPERIDRPPLSADALEWVQVADTAPYFKVTTYNSSGQITNIDTIQGHYTDTVISKSNLGDTDCTTVYYQEAKSALSLKRGNSEYGKTLKIDNAKKSIGFDGSLYQESFDETTQLDSISIDNVLYMNVYKVPNTSFKLFYSKKVGFVLLDYSDIKFEVLP